MDTTKILVVFLGGGLGSSLRLFISFFIAKYFPGQFPLGTLAANFLGCFTIGILMAIFTYKIDNLELKLFFTSGMMGGLTTFSTFSFETITLLKDENYLKAVINISASLFGCLLLTFLGYKMSLSILTR